MATKTAVLFPGQGSQYVGMSKPLIDHFSWTKTLYEEASDSIKVNLLKLCADGPDGELELTFNAQPSILVTSYAWYMVLRKNFGFMPGAGAGHSLGEYSALTAAEALTLSEAIRLVRSRGTLMQEAVPKGKGMMAAIIGLSDDDVKAICEKASFPDSMVVPANFNAPSQVVIAGNKEAVERAMALTTQKTDINPQAKPGKAIRLNVSAPFHSPLMLEVARKFSALLNSAAWRVPKFAIVSNIDGVMRTEGNWVDLLTAQIDHPVLWTSCLGTLATNGFSHFVEVGPGKVLTGLVKRTLPAVKPMSIDSLEDLKKFESLMGP